jgi:hypothetical protein
MTREAWHRSTYLPALKARRRQRLRSLAYGAALLALPALAYVAGAYALARLLF